MVLGDMVSQGDIVAGDMVSRGDIVAQSDVMVRGIWWFKGIFWQEICQLKGLWPMVTQGMWWLR